jgi:gamma-glutamyl phosphate reductase
MTMAADTQTIYEATYAAVAEELRKIGATSEPIQNAVRDWLNRNREDIIYRVAESCGAKVKSFLELNREDIIAALAEKGGEG